MKEWCEHTTGMTCWTNWNFCPICGTPRPVEKKVELPQRINEFAYTDAGSATQLLKETFNQLIDFLATKPWESK